MLYLTKAEKRQQMITNATVLNMKGDVTWFDHIESQIANGIMANPGKREQVILKWITTAEGMSATTVKEKILEIYDKRDIKGADQ
jgi:hypothetical protein